MGFNVDKAFEVPDGIIFSDNGAGFFSGSGTPTDPAPNGSICLDVSSKNIFQRVAGVWKKRSLDNWSVDGNAGTSGTNKIGTTDSKEFSIISNNVSRVTFKTDGKIGFNTSSPDAGVHIKSLFNDKPSLRVDANSVGFVNIIEVRNQGGNLVGGFDPGGGLFCEDPNHANGSSRLGMFTTLSPQSTVHGYLASAFNVSGHGTASGYRSQAEGFKTTATGHECGMTGDRSNGYGAGINGDHDDSVLLGNGITSDANNQFVVGSPGSQIKDCYFGQLKGATPNNITMNFMNALGTDISANVNADFNAPRGTGTGANGKIRFRTAQTTGPTSDTLNALTTILELTANKIGVFNTPAVIKQEVTGSRGGNAALASFLTAIANFGFITDNTTA